MKISVIIPTYKPQSYLSECLDSFKAQTFPHEEFEVIIILNGEKQPYFSTIENYILQNSSEIQIRLIHTQVPGVSNARNMGLDSATGQYVTFIDDDDYVSPQYLEQLYSRASADTLVISYPYFFKDGEPDIQLPYKMTDIYDSFHHDKVSISSPARSFFSGPCMKLFPAVYTADVRFDTRLRNGEDTLFMFAISCHIKNIVFADRTAIYYRRDRVGSAVNVKRAYRDILKSNSLQIVEYIKLFMSKPFSYNFSFFITRVGGALSSIIRLK